MCLRGMPRKRYGGFWRAGGEGRDPVFPVPLMLIVVNPESPVNTSGIFFGILYLPYLKRK